MDADLADDFGVGQADVLPALAGVARLVDAIALDDVAPEAGFTHAGVDNVGIGGRDRDRPDRCRSEVGITDRGPGQAEVARLPDAAADRAEVVLVWA